MRALKLILLPLAFLMAVGFIYWASWEFSYKHRPVHPDPFAPLSTADRAMAIFFRPAEAVDRSVRGWRARTATRKAIQGAWAGTVWHEHDAVEIRIVIQRNTLTFTNAKEWPELHERRFTIHESEDDPEGFHIKTELGRLYLTRTAEPTGSGTGRQLNLSPEYTTLPPSGLFEHPSGQFSHGAMLDPVKE